MLECRVLVVRLELVAGSCFCTRLSIADEGWFWATERSEVYTVGARVSMTEFAAVLDFLRASFKPKFLSVSTLIGGEVSQCRILEK